MAQVDTLSVLALASAFAAFIAMLLTHNPLSEQRVTVRIDDQRRRRR